MDTRILYSVAVVFVVVVGGFYYFSGKSEKLPYTISQDLNSTAKSIVATQTREDGSLYAKVNADTLTVDMKNNRAEINHLKGELFEQGRANATFTAQHGVATNNYKDYELLGGVVLSKISDEKTPSLTLKTERLQGNSETNEIYTDKTVTVQSPQAQFISQGFKGNLSQGQYEFSHIRGRYEPQ